jgi:hypothetical protein
MPTARRMRPINQRTSLNPQRPPLAFPNLCNLRNLWTILIALALLAEPAAVPNQIPQDSAT